MGYSCRLSRRAWWRGATPARIDSQLSVTKAEPARESGGSAESSSERIAKLAYSYWESRGRIGGSALDDWLKAESELRSRLPGVL
jgi:Protein of unknown function (DUF2934)